MKPTTALAIAATCDSPIETRRAETMGSVRSMKAAVPQEIAQESTTYLWLAYPRESEA